MADKQAEFDRRLGGLTGLPDVVHTKPTTVRSTPPLGIGESITCIVQTFRHPDDGDTIFLQHMQGTDYVPLIIPAAVADAIARQRDALGTMNRRKAGRERAAQDKAEGKLPGFMRSKKR